MQEHAKMQTAEVRQKPNTLEQIMKSCQNQGQILRKSYFGFSYMKSIYRGDKKSGHPNFCEEKMLQNYEICLKSLGNFKKI